MADAPDPDRPADTPPEQPMDRRTARDRRAGERRAKDADVPVDRRVGERRQGPRRAKRSMNQYDMDAEVLAFINAINRFKEQSGRAFPTWSEVLGIVKALGYEKNS